MKRSLKVVLPLLILTFAVFGTARLIGSRPEPTREDRTVLLPQVRSLLVEKQPVRLDVMTQGTVLPRTEAILAAEVQGRVVRTSKYLDVGHFVERGAPLVFLDDRDFQLELRQARTRITQAELELSRQLAEARLARREWQTLGEGEAAPLVLREPQVAQAKADLEAARAEIGKIELQLERTMIRAPFRGRISEKLIDIGQYLSPGQSVAKIHAVDFAEVRLPLADQELRFLEIPLGFHDVNGSNTGPEVELSASFSGERQVWQGRIVRSEAEVDSRSRMVHLVARIEDPYGLQNGGTVLPVGLFVEARIFGRRLESAFMAPRSAVDQGQVWIFSAEDTLLQRQVEIARTTGEVAVISSGVEEGETISISRLSAPTEGMQVERLSGDGHAPGATVSLPPTIQPLSPKETFPATQEPLTAGMVSQQEIQRFASEALENQQLKSQSLEGKAPSTVQRRLTRIVTQRLAEGIQIEVHADSELHYSTLSLYDPARFAVDLPDCSPGDQPRVLDLDYASVERIRIGQFRGEPDPITRVVFDLPYPMEPVLERGETWLRIVFPEAPP